MKKLIIVSNRLPISISIEDEQIKVEPSVGGLATGLKSFYKTFESLWIGWSGINTDTLNEKQINTIETRLSEEKCSPVYLSENEFEKYYSGFSNKTIWPLFHYFIQNAKYDNDAWEAYKTVNQKFADEVIKHAKEGDTIWVHDYHLFLLPKLIREKLENVSIGFFLHIPFPSYEIFRTLPWRNELMEGILGSDLIGFHTYDYERHFISCARRLMGLDANYNQIVYKERIVKVDNFPMGIDFEMFNNAAIQQKQLSVKDKTPLQKEIDKYFLTADDRKLILSIDRLDYSKGIPERLEAYSLFLEKNPQYHKKVSLIILAVASRESIDDYQQLKSEVDELVGKINGKFAVFNWTPIWYFYRSMPFLDLITLYCSCDIALITPLRDGMNLVAKEFIATKTDGKGVLILSEMAGAAKEMDECLIVNPNNKEEIADVILKAIEMPIDEQIRRNKIVRNRLQRYDTNKWTTDFMIGLEKIKKEQEKILVKFIDNNHKTKLINDYKKAKTRIFFLDYDGTLMGFKNDPQSVSPDNDLIEILKKLTTDKRNTVVIISGRDKKTLEKWLAHTGVSLIVEHGVWSKTPETEWEIIENIDSEWKKQIRPNMELYVDRTPGSFIEEKNYSLVWHYRKADPNFGKIRAYELKDELINRVTNLNIEILEGDKVIEIKNAGINKGRAARKKIGNDNFDFILCIGDDWTDEYMFEALPNEAYTIKVGTRPSKARFNIGGIKQVRQLLTDIGNEQ